MESLVGQKIPVKFLEVDEVRQRRPAAWATAHLTANGMAGGTRGALAAPAGLTAMAHGMAHGMALPPMGAPHLT